MRHREEWKDWKAEDGMKALRVAMSRDGAVDWGEISDLLWWARKKEEEEDWALPSLFLENLARYFPEHAARGGGWYAGERKVWTLGGVETAMRWIPAGHFLMGAGEEDTEAEDVERPQHEVTITRGFWMGETPVTQREYQAITGKNPSQNRDVGWDAPVEKVAWYEAAAFTKKLCELEGLSPCFVGEGEEMRGVGNQTSDYLGCKGWRLPTEAEWEYACRAGTTTPRYGALDKIAWYWDNGDGGKHLVRQKEANAWGLYDTLGNVSEWCYDEDIEYSGEALLDPLQAAIGCFRVLRGGSWNFNAHRVRAAYRDCFALVSQFNDVGFRVVRSVG